MKIDVAIFGNSLEEDCYKYLFQSLGDFIDGKFHSPLLFELENSVLCGLIVLNVLPNELMTKDGIRKARRQFMAGLKYSIVHYNSRVVLLAASTKRLFGKNLELKVDENGDPDEKGKTLKEMYPSIIFTNGDNGTASILNMEVISALKESNFSSKDAVIINGLGLLGTDALKTLLDLGLADEQIFLISNHTKELEEVTKGRGIKVYTNLLEVEHESVKAIINCTHNPQSLITAEKINHIQKGKLIHALDVAVPYGFPEEEYRKCSNVLRRDAGNAYIPKGLNFYFNPEVCGLNYNILYGCFSEALSIGAFLNEKKEHIYFLQELDLFNVNRASKKVLNALFEKYDISISPIPYNFNKPETNSIAA